MNDLGENEGVVLGFSLVKTPDGRKILEDVKLPKDQRWLLILAKLKQRGYKLKYIYGNQVLDKPMKFAYDEERGGIGVRRPDKVLILKEVTEGYWTEDKQVGDIDFNVWADPTPEESLRIIDLVERL